MNVMPQFVIEGLGNCHVSREGYPKCPSRPSPEYLINVEFDPRRLAFPFSMIESGYPRLLYASSSRCHLAKPFPSRLAGQVCKYNTIKAAQVLVRNPRKQSVDNFHNVYGWRVATVCLVNPNFLVITQAGRSPGAY